MNTQIISSDGFQHFIINGRKNLKTNSDHRSVTISNSFKPWITDYSDAGSDIVALRIDILKLDYFKRKTASDNVKEARLESRLKRLCYINENDDGEIKSFYVSNSCSLPTNITHVCLDFVNNKFIPIKIVRMSISEEKRLLKDLEQKISPKEECVLF